PLTASILLGGFVFLYLSLFSLSGIPYHFLPCYAEAEPDQNHVREPRMDTQDLEHEKVKHFCPCWREFEKIPINYIATQHPARVEHDVCCVTGQKMIGNSGQRKKTEVQENKAAEQNARGQWESPFFAEELHAEAWSEGLFPLTRPAKLEIHGSDGCRPAGYEILIETDAWDQA
ncbi:MAG: hypothetical protein P8Z30_05740, partial [Acidobacteriota bacterium]